MTDRRNFGGRWFGHRVEAYPAPSTEPADGRELSEVAIGTPQHLARIRRSRENDRGHRLFFRAARALTNLQQTFGKSISRLRGRMLDFFLALNDQLPSGICKHNELTSTRHVGLRGSSG